MKHKHHHHPHKPDPMRIWRQRIGLATAAVGVFIFIGHLEHLDLAFKGAELVAGALAHWLFFGSAEL